MVNSHDDFDGLPSPLDEREAEANEQRLIFLLCVLVLTFVGTAAYGLAFVLKRWAQTW